MRKDGTFIAIEVDDAVAADAADRGKLAEVCPVDIFAASDGRLEIVEQNIDECVLCRLCLDAVPEGVRGAEALRGRRSALAPSCGAPYSPTASARRSTCATLALHGKTISSSQPASSNSATRAATCSGVTSAPAATFSAKGPVNA